MSAAASPIANNGLPGPITETFGAFEPRFYGISFLVETPSIYEAWIAHSQIFPGFSGPPMSVFEETCLQTAMEHEIRHFHDALVSPYANTILMLRMMAAANGMKLLERGTRSGANCLPVPATTWMAMNPTERSAWMVEIGDDLPPGLTSPLRPLPLPDLDSFNPLVGVKPGSIELEFDDLNAELRAFAHATLGAYARAADLVRGSSGLVRTSPAFQSYPENAKRALEATFTPRNVFEASALAVQLQAAWTNIGEDAAHALAEHILSSDLGYTQIYRRISRSSAPSDQPGMIDPIRVAAVAVWCLLGDAQKPDDFDPALRLMRLLRLLDEQGIAATEPVAALWDEWDKRLGLKSWRTTVKEMRDRTARSVAMYASAKTRPGESLATVFATVLESYAEDQIRTTDVLLNDPDAYVNTRRYIEATKDVLPVPLISVQLGGNFIVPVDTLPQSDAVRCPVVINKDGVSGWHRSVMDIHRPPRPVLLDAVLELEFICKTCDVVFSNEALGPIDNEVFLKSVTKASGMVPVFVF